MRKTVSKQLRAITNPTASPINRRVYRRLKKQYKKVPHNAKRDFIEATKQFFQLVEKQSRKPVAETGEKQEVPVGQDNTPNT